MLINNLHRPIFVEHQSISISGQNVDTFSKFVSEKRGIGVAILCWAHKIKTKAIITNYCKIDLQ